MTKKIFILAEKPAAAQAIAEALGGFARHDGFLESSQYYLSWAIGHLVELLTPEEYDPRWKRWSLNSLPILPSVFGLKVVQRTRKQFDVIARLVSRSARLVNACDAGREGELIFRYIYQLAGGNQPVQRLWVSSLTKESIRQGFATLRGETEYDRLYQSALCRGQGDWLIGMNATRAFSVKWQELYSVGRVQTPTLALLVRREREIQCFKPEDYWEVQAQFQTGGGETYAGKWFGPDGDRIRTSDNAAAIVARVRGSTAHVQSVEEKPVTERPPQLYDLTSLQRDANRRFHLTAAATLKAAQHLYEQKLITYPRTDSRYLTTDIVRTLPAIVGALQGSAEFRQAAAGADLSLVRAGNRRVVDDRKVTDHHAIIPTDVQPSALSGAEAKVYGLIARRFLAQFYPEARYQETEVITVVGALPDHFRTRGRMVISPGWKAVEPDPPARKGAEPNEVASKVPSLSQGEPVKVRSAESKQKETQPPSRFTEASLLGAMEFAGRAMDDEALKEAMKGRGLGTPATRAAIIERLKDVGYIATDKKALMPTPKGHRLIELAETAGAQVLLSTELTGEWEKRIADIQAGTYEADRFMTEVRNLALHVVDAVRQSEGGAVTAASASAGEKEGLARIAGKCPLCGRAVVKGSREWACVNLDCTLRIPVWLCGKGIDQSLVALLLTKGRTGLLTGFTSPRNGKTFSAYLLLQGGKVTFEFPAERSTKPSGYRRNGAGASTSESTTAAKTGSRSAGSGAAAQGSRSNASKRSGMGRGATSSSKSARTGPRGS